MRNTLVTYPEVGNNFSKEKLIPHVVARIRCLASKDLSLREGPAAHQLVGEVMAHQGYDG